MQCSQVTESSRKHQEVLLRRRFAAIRQTFSRAEPLRVDNPAPKSGPEISISELDTGSNDKPSIINAPKTLATQVSPEIQRLLKQQLNTHLREFRLLNLLPGKNDSTISCELSVVSLDCLPLYEAVSYTWGDSECEKKILLHGKHAVGVTENVEVLLRMLRSHNEPRILWIDALCI